MNSLEYLNQYNNKYLLEKNDKPSFIGQKIISGFKSFAELFRSTKIKINNLPSSQNVSDITKMGYDRLLNDLMEDYTRWERVRKDLSAGERVREMRHETRIVDYKIAKFNNNMASKLENIFKLQPGNWLNYTANYYKMSNGGVFITAIFIEPAKALIDKLEEMNYPVNGNINLVDIITQDNIPNELQSLIERYSKYYVYCNPAAEKWIIFRQGVGFRQYIIHLSGQSYGKINRDYESSITLSPDKILQKLEDEIGITNKYTDADYIFPNGKMLNSHEFNSDEITQMFGQSIDILDIENMLLKIGSIKIVCTDTNFQFKMSKKPTNKQFTIIETILNNYRNSKGSIVFNIENYEEVKHYNKSEPFEIINDIKNNFKSLYDL